MKKCKKIQKGYIWAPSKYILRSSNENISNSKYRNDFIRDRDRILYSKPFRRLSRKTQIFLPAFDDHVRTRLTHSLEVAQIATLSATALGIDRDLTEAIALGHDIGHTPFGHTGERVLNLIATNCDSLSDLSIQLDEEEMGFKHNLQGVRLAAELTDLYDTFKGINLSNFTLWGIKNHTGDIWKKCIYAINGKCKYTQNRNKEEGKCKYINKKNENEIVLNNKFYNQYNKMLQIKDEGREAWSFEGLLVKYADEIAQRHHDIEDGLIANVIKIDEILELIKEFLYPYFTQEEKKIFNSIKKSETRFAISKLSKLVVGYLNRS
ncbi:MAG: dNTP triphosphohydrolase [Deltaproteobacteria bacterium]|nr:dNTP triphosphohydrolase [Deltaproteobacteria bacterium]